MKIAKYANFWTNGPFQFIFSELLAGLNQEIEKSLLQFGMVWYDMVKRAKNANFWTDGPF